MDNERKIQIGDIVRLISGGPKMTVVHVERVGANWEVGCLYINSGEPKMITDIPTSCIGLCSYEPQSDRFIPDVESTKKV